MSPSRPRLLPDEPLPPYTYIPGQAPHPVSDPQGHWFGRPFVVPTPLDSQRWYESSTYLHGLDLFNHSFFWEAHEVWEGLWHAAGRKGTTADFLKGLIRLAAAGVKHLANNPQGVKSHASRAAQLWRTVAQSLEAGQEQFLGLRVEELLSLAEGVARDGWPDRSPLLWPTLPATG
jgi:predicted metal-dependent hydrolase